jgi:regulator of replication initiation timing
LNLKEEENVALNEQLQKLSKQLDDDRKQISMLSQELTDVKSFYKKLSEQNTYTINQLEMDNKEIKKRLIKLIK